MGIIDLDEVLKVWAWEHYLNTNTGFWSKLFHRKLKYKNASITLNYEHVKIREGKVNYSDGTDNNMCTKVVVESEYENETSQDQTHSFRTQRETVSTATIALTKGYSKSFNAGLEMTLPDDLIGDGQSPRNDKNARKKQMATASFGNSVHLETEEGNTVQKSLKWEVDTTISSMRDNTTIARLEVEENTSMYAFAFNVKVRGRIIAIIKDARGEGKQIHTVEGNIATVLKDLQYRGQSKVRDFAFDMDKLSAFIPIEGTVVFKYGVSQRVKVAYADRSGQSRAKSMYPGLP